MGVGLTSSGGMPEPSVPVGSNHSLEPCVTACNATTSCIGFSVADAYAPDSCSLHHSNGTNASAALTDVACRPAEPRSQFAAFFSKPGAAIPGKLPYQQFAGLMPLDRAKTAARITCPRRSFHLQRFNFLVALYCNVGHPEMKFYAVLETSDGCWGYPRRTPALQGCQRSVGWTSGVCKSGCPEPPTPTCLKPAYVRWILGVRIIQFRVIDEYSCTVVYGMGGG